MSLPLRIFISSPSDVEVERQIALQVVERLAIRYQNSVQLKPILWEREPLLASGHFNDALDPSTADLVVCILWSRLGSPLPPKFAGPDGRTGLTGTEWEFEKALASYESNGRPDLLVYRKLCDVTQRLDDESEVLERIKEKKKLDAFFQRHFHNEDESRTFKRAYFAFSGSDGFEDQLETHLAELIEQKIRQAAQDGRSAPLTAVTWHSGSPFRGLAPFEKEHRTIFFGRTQAIGDILSRFQHQVESGSPFLMLTGSSGAGKSSLLNAGVLPLLEHPRVVRKEVGHVITLRTRPALLEHPGGLIKGFCQFLSDQASQLNLENLPPLEPDLLEEQILGSPKTLQHSLHQLNSAKARAINLHEKVSCRLLLVIDQFEELFTSKAFERAQQEAFCQSIRSLMDTGEVWVLGTLRSDFLSDTEGTYLVELMRDQGSYVVQPPRPHEIEQIIVKPARAAGYDYESNAEGTSLATVIREAMREQGNALPLMEFCLDALFQQRDEANKLLTFAGYEAVGRLEGAISQRAEETLQSLEKQGIAIETCLPRLFHALISINPSAEETASSRLMPHDAFPEDGDEEIRKIIETLLEARLLVSLQDNDRHYIRIAHEALINHWDRVKQWIHRDIEFLKWHARVEREARLWEQEGAPRNRLLPRGKPLADAEAFFASRQADIAPHIQQYIVRSIRHHRNRRHTRWAIAGAVFVCLSLLTVYSWNQKQWAERKEQEAERNRQQAKLEQSSYLMDLARQQLDQGKTDTALLLGLNAMPGVYGGERPLPRNTSPLITATYESAIKSLLSHQTGVEVVTFSQDGELIATGTLDGEVKIWSVATGQALQAFKHQEAIQDLSFSPDGKWLATASRDETAAMWSTESGERLHTFQHGSWVTSVQFSPDSRHLLTGSADKYAHLWSTGTGEETARLEHDALVVQGVFSPDGSLIATGAHDNLVRLWTSQGTLQRTLKGHRNDITFLAFSPDGQWLASASMDDSAILWEVGSGEMMHQFEHDAWVNHVAFSPDQAQLVTSSEDGWVKVWDASNGQTLRGFKADSRDSRPLSAAFIPGQARIISADHGGVVYLWDLESGALLKRRDSHQSFRRMALHPNAQTAATATQGGDVILWDTQPTELPRQRFGDTISSLTPIPDQETAVYSTWNGLAGVLSLKDGSIIWEIPLGLTVAAADYDPERDVLAIATRDTGEGGTLSVWKRGQDTPLWVNKNPRSLLAVRLLPERQQVITTGSDGQVHLFDIASGESLWENELEGWGHRILLTPDLSSLAVLTTEGQIARFRLPAGELPKPIRHTERHTGVITRGIFSPDSRVRYTSGEDGRILISGDSTDQSGGELIHRGAVQDFILIDAGQKLISATGEPANQAIVWDTRTREQLMAFHHEAPLLQVAYNATEKLIATSDVTGNINLWDMTLGERIYQWKSPHPTRFLEFIQGGTRLLTGDENGDLYIRDLPLRGDALVNAAIAALPNNRRCLSPAEREAFFLEPLTLQEALERNCAEVLLLSIIETQDVNGLQNYISQGKPVGQLLPNGQTPLIAAARTGNEQLLDVLIKAGLNPNQSIAVFGTPLLQAAMHGHLAVVNLLVAGGTRLDERSADGWTPLQAALREGNWEVALALINAGADVQQTSPLNQTVLHLSVSPGHQEAMKEQARQRVISALLTRNPPVDAVDRIAETALDQAVQRGDEFLADALLNAGADPDMRGNTDSWTPLMYAVSNGQESLVKRLLAARANPNLTDDDAWTALHFVANASNQDVPESTRVKIAELLLNQGAEIDAINANEHTLLTMAASNNFAQLVALLLEKGANPSQASRTGWTPLMSAVNEGNVSMAAQFIAAGADVLAREEDQWTALHFTANNNAMAEETRIELARQLLAAGIPIDSLTAQGSTPLKMAAGKGYTRLAAFLLEQGASPNAQDNEGWSPLMSAVNNGHVDTVKLLLAKGANVTLTEEDNWTALHFAANKNELNEATRVDIADLLIKAGGSVNALTTSGTTPLRIAVNNDLRELAKALVNQGADLNHQDGEGWSALMSAANRGHAEMIRLLLDLGADPNLREEDDWTALHFTGNPSNEGDEEMLARIVESLVKAGANINAVAANGLTPLHLAAYSGRLPVAEKLLQLGADANVLTQNRKTPADFAKERGHDAIYELLQQYEQSI